MAIDRQRKGKSLMKRYLKNHLRNATNKKGELLKNIETKWKRRNVWESKVFLPIKPNFHFIPGWRWTWWWSWRSWTSRTRRKYINVLHTHSNTHPYIQLFTLTINSHSCPSSQVHWVMYQQICIKRRNTRFHEEK